MDGVDSPDCTCACKHEPEICVLILYDIYDWLCQRGHAHAGHARSFRPAYAWPITNTAHDDAITCDTAYNPRQTAATNANPHAHAVSHAAPDSTADVHGLAHTVSRGSPSGASTTHALDGSASARRAAAS